MARVTVEDCLEYTANRFELVSMASRRARQIAMRGAEPGVDRGKDKATVIALREIAAGMVDLADKEDARIKKVDQSGSLFYDEDESENEDKDKDKVEE